MYNRTTSLTEEKPAWRREIHEEIGEDPAEALDKPLVPPSTDRHSPLLQARARIRGIDYLDVLDTWEEVERRLDRGPRDTVLAWIEERREFLEEHGERDERMASQPRRTVPDRDDQEEDNPEYLCGTCNTTVEDRKHGYHCPNCDHLTRNVQEVTCGGETA